MKTRLLCGACVLALLLASAPVYAAPAANPKPPYGYCVRGKSRNYCIWLPNGVGRAIDKYLFASPQPRVGG